MEKRNNKRSFKQDDRRGEISEKEITIFIMTFYVTLNTLSQETSQR